MTITYFDSDAKKHRRLRLSKYGRWTGDDRALVELLNLSAHSILVRHHYFPTPWHEAKAVADALGGTLDEPEPDFETGEHDGRVY